MKRVGIHTPGLFDFLNANSICIDLGANQGEITAFLNDRGAEVWAVEPHPYAAEQLQKRFRDNPKVHIINKAAGVTGGKAKLFFHKDATSEEASTGQFSTSASLVQEKVNVSKENFIEVDIMKLSDFVDKNFNQEIDLIKMDVEGLEADLLNDLIESRQIKKVKHIFVETHESRIEGLGRKLFFIKVKLFFMGKKGIRFDWV